MIKVYFVGSLATSPDKREIYKRIANIFEDNDCEVWDDVNHITPEGAQAFTDKEIKEYQIGIETRIRNCDIFVAEISKPSSSIGYEMCYALTHNKPTLLLRDGSLKTKLGAPLRGNPSKLLHIGKYTNSDLEKKILTFLRKARKGIFVTRTPIDFTQEQVDYIKERQEEGTKRKSFASTVRKIIQESIENKK